MDLNVHDEKGKVVGKVTMDESLLGERVRTRLLREAVLMYMARQRAGVVVFAAGAGGGDGGAIRELPLRVVPTNIVYMLGLWPPMVSSFRRKPDSSSPAHSLTTSHAARGATLTRGPSVDSSSKTWSDTHTRRLDSGLRRKDDV